MSNFLKIHNKLNVDENLFNFLNSSGSYIARLFLGLPIQFFTGEFDYFKSESDSIISFRDMKNENENERIRIRVGRLVSNNKYKIFNEELSKHGHDIKDHNVEDFVNSYKSYFEERPVYFKIVEGKEIANWYYEGNYYSGNNCMGYGTLWKSCMKGISKQKFFDIYIQNAKMLLLLINTEAGEKLVARALLWDNVEVIKKGESVPNIKVMDRIYTIFDNDVEKFKRWAVENGYHYKFRQDSRTRDMFVFKEKLEDIEEPKNLKLEISINGFFNQYPYLDTFPYHNNNMGRLGNYDHDKWNWYLVQTNGSLYNEDYSSEEDYEYDYIDGDL